MKKYVLGFTALAMFAFADNFIVDAPSSNGISAPKEKNYNTMEQMTATPNEIKNAASSVETAKPAPVHSVKVVKSGVKSEKITQKHAKIAKKQVKSKKIAKKSSKKAHKKVAKKAHKKSAKKA